MTETELIKETSAKSKSPGACLRSWWQVQETPLRWLLLSWFLLLIVCILLDFALFIYWLDLGLLVVLFSMLDLRREIRAKNELIEKFERALAEQDQVLKLALKGRLPHV